MPVYHSNGYKVKQEEILKAEAFLGEALSKSRITKPAAPVRRIGGACVSRLAPLADRQFIGEYATLKGLWFGRQGVHSTVGSAEAITSLSHSTSSAPSAPTTRKHPLDLTVRKPAPWRYQSDQAQALFGFEALQELGPVIGFTAHLSAEVNAKAYASGQPLAFIRKRVREALSSDFLFTIEEERDRTTGVYSLHIHGVMQTSHARRHLVKVRADFRRALGTWSGSAAKHQVRFRLAPDAGWIGYITKRTWLAAPRMRAFMATFGTRHSYLLHFPGPVLTMTTAATRLGIEKLNQARTLVEEARHRPAAIEAPPAAPEPTAPASESRSESYGHSTPAHPDHVSVNHVDNDIPAAEPELTNQSQGPPAK